MMPAHNQGGIDRGESEGDADPAQANHASTNPSAETAGSPPVPTQRECNSAYKASVWSWVPRYQSASGSPSNSASSNSTASQTMPTTPGPSERGTGRENATSGTTGGKR